MAHVPGVRRRPDGSLSVLLQGRVDPEVRKKANEMAHAAGVSMSAFLEYMIRAQELDAHGRPVCVPDLPASTDMELDLSEAS